MKYLTYIFIAGLMLLVVGCDWIEDTTGRNFDGVFEKATPTPDTSIHVEDLISQYQNDKEAFTNKYKDNDLQITVRGTILDRFCCPSGRAYVEIGDEELGDKCLYEPQHGKWASCGVHWNDGDLETEDDRSTKLLACHLKGEAESQIEQVDFRDTVKITGTLVVEDFMSVVGDGNAWYFNYPLVLRPCNILEINKAPPLYPTPIITD